MFYDIETSPCVGLFWGAGYDVQINHDSIVEERAVMTIAWKWEGFPKVYHLSWDRYHCDKEMLIQFINEANEADELVAHYGDRFDMPWIRTRCLFHKIAALPLYKTVDTKSWASKHFYFNSNKLDYIAKFFGLGGKIKTDYNLWKNIVLKNCAKSMDKMIRYNKNDVVILEKVWKRMQLAVPHQTHVGVMNGGPRWSCPHDGSENVWMRKVRITAAGTKQFQMQCKDCGGYYKIGLSDYEKYKEAKA